MNMESQKQQREPATSIKGMKRIKISLFLFLSKPEESSWDPCPAWLLARVTEMGSGFCRRQLTTRLFWNVDGG